MTYVIDREQKTACIVYCIKITHYQKKNILLPKGIIHKKKIDKNKGGGGQ